MEEEEEEEEKEAGEERRRRRRKTKKLTHRRHRHRHRHRLFNFQTFKPEPDCSRRTRNCTKTLSLRLHYVFRAIKSCFLNLCWGKILAAKGRIPTTKKKKKRKEKNSDSNSPTKISRQLNPGLKKIKKNERSREKINFNQGGRRGGEPQL